MTAGYSETPLAKKLSLKDSMRVWRLDMPDSVAGEIDEAGPALELLEIRQLLSIARIFS